MMWASEWNNYQSVGHIEPLDEYIAECNSKLKNEIPQLWTLIGVSKTQKSAKCLIEKFMDKNIKWTYEDDGTCRPRGDGLG